MNFNALFELFSVRDIRNAAIGFSITVGGVGLALATAYLHRYGYHRGAGIAAGISLVFVLLILVFVVPPLARNASKEASQLNLPFEFTTGGAVMLGLIVIVGFSAWNTGNNLLFLVLSFLAAAMIIGFFAGGLSLKKLDVKMRFPETIFAGEETPILVSVQNRKRLLPSYSIIAEVRGKEREQSIVAHDFRRILPRPIAERLSKAPIVRRTLNYFVHIPRRETVESKSAHIFPNRGRFLIKDFELSTRFPFAFFRHRRRLPAKETELIVFPKLEPLANELDDFTLEIGKIAANKRGSGQDLLGMRDYQTNDDLRRIDWKATARTSRLIVREFAAEDDKKITIFLDNRIPAGNGKRTLREKIEAEQAGKSVVESERFEEGVRQAASLIAHFNADQAEIRLVAGSDVGEFGVGARHLHALLTKLATIGPEYVENLDPRPIIELAPEIFEEKANSYNFLVSTVDETLIPPEITQRTQVIGF